jgi:hypothetical protein
METIRPEPRVVNQFMGVVAEVGSDVVANILDSVVRTCPTGEDDRRYRGQ